MEVFEDNEESSAEDYIDPLKAVRSPPPQPPSQSESIEGRPAVSPRSWSTSINTFFPEDCVRSPLIHPAGMDAETFNPLMISIRREIHNVEQKIKGFTAAHVRLDLKEEVSTRLEKLMIAIMYVKVKSLILLYRWMRMYRVILIKPMPLEILLMILIQKSLLILSKEETSFLI